MFNFPRTGRFVLVFSGCLAAFQFLAPSAQSGGKKPEPQAASNNHLIEAIYVLATTRTVLQNANHDYGGHRAAAIQEINGAMTELKLALLWVKKNYSNTLPGNYNPNAKVFVEPQAISNFQLHEAIKILEKTHGVLKNARHDYGGHKGNAMRDIHAANVQLRMALKFVKK